MSEARIHGKTLAERFPLDDASAIVARVLHETETGAFEIRGDNPPLAQSGPPSYIDDPIIRHLGAALRGDFAHPEPVSRVFLDHVSRALAIHVAQTYGGMRVASPGAKGGLAPWQLRRSTELFAANLDSSVALKTLADACGLSTGHFSRAFRVSTGLTPSRWLTHRRIEVATALLRQRRDSLGQIALACGFSDQSHFTRIFTRIVGTSPGAWRRNLDG
jgi:AraC family transcriptional regulator